MEQLSPELLTEDILDQIHAIVASRFEFFKQPLIPYSLPQYEAIDAAIVAGSNELGPLFYRGFSVEVTGVGMDGSLMVMDEHGTSFQVDEPEEIQWSNIKFGV